MIARRRSPRWLVVLVAVLAVIVGVATSAQARTTTASASTFVYDAQSNGRVDAQAFGGAKDSPIQRSDVREGSASPPAKAQGTSTTRTARGDRAGRVA